MDSVIFIPTRGRPLEQKTLRYIPRIIRQHVIVVCDPGEQNVIRSEWKDSIKDVIEVGVCNLSQKRQRCIELSEQDHIIFADDNCSFHTIHPSDKGAITKFPLKGLIEKNFSYKARMYHIGRLFDLIDQDLKSEEFGMIGVAHRRDHMSVVRETPYPAFKLNERFYGIWGINRVKMNALPNAPKFDDVVLKQDFYMILQFLTNGIPVKKIYEYAFDKTGGANMKGGCSTYRTIELLKDEAYRLKGMFPAFVHLKRKSAKSWGGINTEYIIDVTIDCKKAYEYGCQKDKHPKGFI